MKHLLVIASLAISTFAFAADTYRGNLESTNKVGKTVNWQFDLTYQAKDNKDITGTLRVWGAGPCQGDQPIEGFINDSAIEFKVAEHPVVGCGGNKFVGKIEPDALVGKYFFQGKFHEVTLKKQ